MTGGETTRRCYLRVLGLSGIAGFAGCSSNGSNDDDGTGAQDQATTTVTNTKKVTPTDTLTPATVSDDQQATDDTTSVETTVSLATTGTADTPTSSTTVPGTTVGSNQQAMLSPDDGTRAADRFGNAVAISNDGSTAIIGAYHDEDPNGRDAGSAYVYTKSTDTWMQEAKLTPDDGDSGDEFGSSVALSSDGTTALIGAHNDDDPADGFGAGSAYLFEETDSEWSQLQKLTANDADSGDAFGDSVALFSDGTTAIVGAPGDEDPNGDGAGSAYIFTDTEYNWDQETKLSPGDVDGSDTFGVSAALSDDGTTAIIGAKDDENPNGDNTGSAYVFETGGWSQETKLTPEDGDGDTNFGESAALSDDGTTAIVSAEGGNQDDLSVESAYVFSESNESWSQEAKLTFEYDEGNDLFGEAVALSDDGTTAIVGAEGVISQTGSEVGAAYVFNRVNGTWKQEAKLTDEDEDTDFGYWLGASAALSSDGTIVILGAPRYDAYSNSNHGAAYVFEVP